MRTFYRSESVLVTDEFFRIRGTPDRAVAISKIDHVYAVSTRTHLAMSVLVRRLYPASALLGIAVVAVVNEIAFRKPDLRHIIQGTLLIAAACLLMYPWQFNRSLELWAVVGGERVCLYRSTDRQTFYQIHRALRRAQESST
jgi:hypothetical protein